MTHSTDSRLSSAHHTPDMVNQDEYAPVNQYDNSDTEESSGDDDACFVTPEDPKGVELVVNLLTTWGDKYYIGLNGIEIYTNTGEPAEVAKVTDTKTIK